MIYKMIHLKLITLNAGNSLVLGGLLSIIRMENPNIVFLQEITVTSGQLKLYVAKYGYNAEANTDLLDIIRLGTGMVWRHDVPLSEVTSVVECRAQFSKLGSYSLMNLDAPSGTSNKTSRRLFFGEDIFRLIRSTSSASYPIIAGDFNCVLSSLDTENNFEQKKCPVLKELINVFNYSDAFRLIKPNVSELTFHIQKSTASRLDRFYVPQNCVPFVQNVSHHASLSDHHYVVLILNLTNLENIPLPPKSPPLYWKLNTSILQDDDFLENFETFYGKIRSKIDEFHDIANWWDLLAKPAIREFCIDVSERLSFVRKNTKRFLFSYLTLVTKKGNWNEVVRVREDLKRKLLKESMGFVIRSRHKENLEDEKSSLFYLNRENKNFSKCSLNKLKINNKITSDKKTIESAVLKYFGALFNGHHDRNCKDSGRPFKPDYSGLPDFLENLGSLSDDSQEKLIQKLNFDDLTNIVLKKCDKNKSPGLDGLPYEFYQATWKIIGLDFLDVLQVQLDRFRLVDSDRCGATRLTSKVGENEIPGVDELRPITL